MACALRLTSCVANSLLLLLAVSAQAQDAPSRNLSLPTDPVFEARLVDGSTATGHLIELRPDGNLLLRGQQDRTIPLSDLVSLTRDGDTPPSYPEGSLVVFPDGDRLRAIINSADDTTLEIQPGALSDVPTRIPLNAMLAVLLSPPSEPRPLAKLLANLNDSARNSDVLWLANGDRLTGDLVGLTPESVPFQPEAKVIEVPRAGVLAVGFNPKTIRYPKPNDGLFLELTFTDGSRLGVTGCSVEKGNLACTARFGAEIRPSLSSISRIYVRGGRVRYLSEMDDAGTQYVGYLGDHPGRYGRNQTWDGYPLKLGHAAYDRGLGMLPRTLVAYKLAPEDRAFQATIGLDDRAGERGSVVLRVLVDGKQAYASRLLTRRDAPEFVNVDLKGARLLILVAEFGESGDIQDSADWIDARLVR